MKIKLPYGTTAENNQLTLEAGELAVDLERKALRLHDGVTQGGFEVLGERAVKVPFQREVPTGELVTGNELASLLGLTAGTAQHSAEPWLHFLDPGDGLHKYVAKKPYRYGLSWDHLNAVNAVYGNRTVELHGRTYKVRLLKGANADPTDAPSGTWSHPSVMESEWDRLLGSVHNGVHRDNRNTTPPGITPLYSDDDLTIMSGNGRTSWCQETNLLTPNDRLSRGGNGIGFIAYTSFTSTLSSRGWRPVLELVE